MCLLSVRDLDVDERMALLDDNDNQTLTRTIRRLPEGLVNRIAAGEVIERPASAIKELVENSIDAGATRIDVVMREGGRTLMTVTDNGYGMSKDELILSIERHATSKLPDDNLNRINTLGFRGEALPSIASVSRMEISSRAVNKEDAWKISIEGGLTAKPVPAAIKLGTKVEIRDLFYATPARLKFLKTVRTEFNLTAEVIRKLAMANPQIAFTLGDGDRTNIRLNVAQGDFLKTKLARLTDVMGQEFESNALAIHSEREGFVLTGFIGLPTMNRRTSSHQFLFIDGRPVRDKLLYGSVRGAYSDFVAYDRHPIVALFLETPAGAVDVNVHPAKTEVRFQEPGLVRGLIVGSLKSALAEAGHRASTTVSTAALGALNKSMNNPSPRQTSQYTSRDIFKLPPNANNLKTNFYEYQKPSETASLANTNGLMSSDEFDPNTGVIDDLAHFPLGAAKTQLHSTYIVSQNKTGIIITDQHAAHERIVYEKMKHALTNGGIKRQILLIPEVVELEASKLTRLLEQQIDFSKFGFIIEEFGSGALIVREVPSLIGEADIQTLIKDLADDLEEIGSTTILEDKLGHICGTLACYGSVRAGRSLNIEEMNTLLREMENTPHSGQCNHGRPTYVELNLTDVERLFGRR